MQPSDYDSTTPQRLAATGSREPGWARLPEEPPHHGGLDVPVPTTRVRPIAPPMSAAPSQPSPRAGGGWWQLLLAAVLGGGLALAGFLLLDSDTTTPPAAEAAAPAVAGAEPAPAVQAPAEVPAPRVEIESTDAVAIGTKVIPSIVTVEVGAGTGTNLDLSGSGSGVILDTAGHIVTNDHVVAAGASYQVVLSDGRTTYEAELIGTDPLTDLAVLKIDAPNLTPVELGATESLNVGDTAVAVGSPLGLDGGPSLTVGVVSAFGRQVQVSANDTLYGMLQTDAPITQGSSGGALVDGLGRLIGITTAVGVSDVGVEGIGFATPVELMRRVTDELITAGEINHAFLGILGATSFSTTADGARVAAGVEVASVEEATGAMTGGLVSGDLITAIDGEPVTTMDDLVLALRYRTAGDGITITVSDGDLTRDLDITLGERP
ncbi:MAG TPA: trypsin-like peptidase domain-containing protein [Acidimicrobiia bacterium]|nr:trypsin-like peptidase domain-containing protein [Acidimicrobiia bacterium]